MLNSARILNLIFKYFSELIERYEGYTKESNDSELDTLILGKT